MFQMAEIGCSVSAAVSLRAAPEQIRYAIDRYTNNLAAY
jgi:hypothetical protein